MICMGESRKFRKGTTVGCSSDEYVEYFFSCDTEVPTHIKF